MTPWNYQTVSPIKKKRRSLSIIFHLREAEDRLTWQEAIDRFLTSFIMVPKLTVQLFLIIECLNITHTKLFFSTYRAYGHSSSTSPTSHSAVSKSHETFSSQPDQPCSQAIFLKYFGSRNPKINFKKLTVSHGLSDIENVASKCFVLLTVLFITVKRGSAMHCVKMTSLSHEKP
jgi:hypothetical protein